MGIENSKQTANKFTNQQTYNQLSKIESDEVYEVPNGNVQKNKEIKLKNYNYYFSNICEEEDTTDNELTTLPTRLRNIQTDDKIKLIQNIKSNIREEYEMFTDSVSSDINVNQNQILKKDEKACQQMVKNKFF